MSCSDLVRPIFFWREMEKVVSSSVGKLTNHYRKEELYVFTVRIHHLLCMWLICVEW